MIASLVLFKANLEYLCIFFSDSEILLLKAFNSRTVPRFIVFCFKKEIIFLLSVLHYYGYISTYFTNTKGMKHKDLYQQNTLNEQNLQTSLSDCKVVEIAKFPFNFLRKSSFPFNVSFYTPKTFSHIRLISHKAKHD